MLTKQFTRPFRLIRYGWYKLRKKKIPPAHIFIEYSPKTSPLSKSYFCKGRKAIDDFSKIIWYGGSYVSVSYRSVGKEQYRKVEGFHVAPKLIVIRGMRRHLCPELCFIIAQKFGGRIPSRAEMHKIIAVKDRLCASLTMVGDLPLYKGNYLIAERGKKNSYLAINIENPQIEKTLSCYDECYFFIVR